MYGYTPPAVLAIDPALLSDCGGFQRIAWALAGQLQHRAVWVVVRVPEELDEAEPEEQDAVLESYFMDPGEAPAKLPDDLDEAVALALQSHLRRLGVDLPIVAVPEQPPPHGIRSAIVPGSWLDAAEVATRLGASRVMAWAGETQWVPRSVSGVPFDSMPPGGPRLDGLPVGG